MSKLFLQKCIGLLVRGEGIIASLRRRLQHPSKSTSIRGARDLSTPPDSAAWERIYDQSISPVVSLQSPVAQAIVDATSAGDILLEAGYGSGKISAELAHGGRVIELADFSSHSRSCSETFEASTLPPPATHVLTLPSHGHCKQIGGHCLEQRGVGALDRRGTGRNCQ